MPSTQDKIYYTLLSVGVFAAFNKVPTRWSPVMFGLVVFALMDERVPSWMEVLVVLALLAIIYSY